MKSYICRYLVDIPPSSNFIMTDILIFIVRRIRNVSRRIDRQPMVKTVSVAGRQNFWK